MKKTFKKLAMISAAALSMNAASHSALSAQDAETLLAIEILVNDTPITTWDIEKRLRFVIARSGGVSSQQELLDLRDQVKEIMIGEALKIQMARDDFQYELSDADMEDLFIRQAQGFGMSPAEFESTLLQIGSSKSAIINQMRAEMIWDEITSVRLGDLVSIPDEEVELVMQKTFDNKGKFEFRVSEIELRVANSAQEASVKVRAENLVKQLREGASFSELARQLSIAPTATVGGDRGWVLEGDLDAETAELLKSMNADDVTDPIRSPGGYIILGLQDRRRILTADKLDAQFTVAQVFLPIESTEDETVTSKFLTALEQADNYTCDNIQSLIVQTGSPVQSTQLLTFRARDMLATAQLDMSDYQVGDHTPVLKMEDGWRMLFTCTRVEPTVNEPDFDSVMAQLEAQKLQMLSRRWLRDLRRNAIIENRN